MKLRLGDLLVERGALTAAQRDEVLRIQSDSGRPFGVLAEELFGVHPRVVEQAWADQYAARTEVVDLRRERFDPSALHLLEPRQAWQFRALPLRAERRELMIATVREHLLRAMRFIGWRFARPSFFVLAEPAAMAEALTRYYPIPGMSADDLVAAG